MGIKNRVSFYKSMFLLIETVENYKFNLKRDHLIAQPTNRNFSNRSFANPKTRSHFESAIAMIDLIELKRIDGRSHFINGRDEGLVEAGVEYVLAGLDLSFRAKIIFILLFLGVLLKILSIASSYFLSHQSLKACLSKMFVEG